MLFKREVTLKSKFEVGKLFDKLEAAIEYDIKNIGKRKFRGKVDRDNGTFKISQAIDVIERDNFRPLINGAIWDDKENDVRIIKLEFSITGIDKIIPYIGIAIIGFVAFLFLILTGEHKVPMMKPVSTVYKTLFFIMPILMTILVIFLPRHSFKVKSLKAINDLSFIFGVREV